MSFGQVRFVDQLPLDLQARLREGSGFTPIGRVHRDWLLGAAIVVGTMLAVVGVLSAARTELFSRPVHMLAIVGATLAGAVLGNHARRDLRRHGFELLGVEETSLLLVSRDRIRVIPAERLQVTKVGDTMTLSIGGSELMQVTVDAVTRRIEDAIARAHDTEAIARDRWRLAPVGLPRLESSWSPVVVGGIAAATLTLGVSAALSKPAPPGVSWADVGRELAAFDQVDREVRAAVIASDVQLADFIAKYRADTDAGMTSTWFEADTQTILEAIRARIAMHVERAKRAPTYDALRDRWKQIATLTNGLENVVGTPHVRDLRKANKLLEPVYEQRAQQLVDAALARSTSIFDDGERLEHLQQTYHEARSFGLATAEMKAQIRSGIEARLTAVAGDLDALLLLADTSSGFMDDTQLHRLWDALTVHIPRASRLQQLSDMATYEQVRDRRIDALMARARALLPDHLRVTGLRIQGASEIGRLLSWDEATLEAHTSNVMREALDHAVSVGIPVRDIADRLRTPSELALLAASVDEYKDDDEVDIVRAVANQRADREPDLKRQLAWADAGRAKGESIEAWRCARMFRRSPRVAPAQQAFYHQLAIRLCENRAQRLEVGGDADNAADLALATTLARTLVAAQNMPQLEGVIVDPFDYTDVTIVRHDGPCRIELDDSDLAIPCGRGGR